MIIAAVVWHTGSLVCDSVLCRIVLLSCLQGRCVQHAQTAGNMFCAIVLYRKWFVLYRILLSRWVCCPCHCFPGMLIRCLLRSTVRMSVYERRKRAKQVMYIVCIDCVVCNLCNLWHICLQQNARGKTRWHKQRSPTGATCWTKRIVTAWSSNMGVSSHLFFTPVINV